MSIPSAETQPECVQTVDVVARTRPAVREGSAPTWIRALLEGAKVGDDLVILRPGHLVPGTRYRLIRWLGEGGMGVVYEAEHVDLERRAAVKILRAEICKAPSAIRAFHDEARAASRIGSDLIVQLYDFAELPDDRLMIAMELLEGHSLHRALEGPMEPVRAIPILRQVCQGLAAAHDAGVVHRDVKPENVFVTTKNGRADAVKLVDFGMAAIHDGTESTAIRGGTPYYLAPEVTTSGSVAPSVDIYAWGIMAFELLTGTLPFDAPEPSDLLRAHVEQPPPRPSSRCSEIPPALDAVVLRCLEKDPSVRPRDMREVEALLCEAQLECGLQTAWDDLPIPEVEPERRERLLALLPELGVPPPRRRLVALGAIAVVALLTVGTVVGAITLRGSSPASDLEASAWVEERATQARDAAAKALFVYPPVDEPTYPTAYRVVEQLEAREGSDRDAAIALAEQLREELSTTLVRLGDEYWDEPGGRPFAAAYYEQAVLFDPEHERARLRSEVSDEQLVALAARAGTLGFSAIELLGAEPLVVLAAPDPASRARKLEALRDKRRRRDSALDAQLARLGGLSPAAYAVSQEPVSAAGRRRGPRPGEGPALEPYPDPGLELPPDPDDASPSETSRADQSKADQLARRGKAALVAGKLARAMSLFEQALGHDRHNVTALAGLRDVAFERGAYGRAVRYGERAVRGRPNDATHRLRLGDAYLKVLRYRDALAQYERAQALGEGRADWRIDKLRKKLGP